MNIFFLSHSRFEYLAGRPMARKWMLFRVATYKPFIDLVQDVCGESPHPFNDGIIFRCPLGIISLLWGRI
jgi:hypothetical protein